MTINEMRRFVESYDYRIVSRSIFEQANLPLGLRNRASVYPGNWVVYDPLDDEDGYLLIMQDSDDLVRQAYQYVLERIG